MNQCVFWISYWYYDERGNYKFTNILNCPPNFPYIYAEDNRCVQTCKSISLYQKNAEEMRCVTKCKDPTKL